jgi:hypothetical protein
MKISYLLTQTDRGPAPAIGIPAHRAAGGRAAASPPKFGF